MRILNKIGVKARYYWRNRCSCYLHVSNRLGIRYGCVTPDLLRLFQQIASTLGQSKRTYILAPAFANRGRLLNRLDQCCRSALEQDIEIADRICQHEIPIFGYGMVSVGEDIDWARDFVASRSWESSCSRKLDILKGNEGMDVKVPWELNRMHHLLHLGKAYFLTGNEKYLGEYMRQVDGWMSGNPPLYGINWTCAMEVAIRMVNFIESIFLFNHQGKLPQGFLVQSLINLDNHGRFIFWNLENTGPSPNNHYLANLVGLLLLSTTFPELEWAPCWRRFAHVALEAEVQRQVQDDGSDYEGSIPYHGFVLEMLLLPVLGAARFTNPGDLGCSAMYLHKLRQMANFTLHSTRPDGTAPQVGDNDAGRILPISGYGRLRPCDHRNLLAVAGELLDDDAYRAAAGDRIEDIYWFFEKPKCELFVVAPQISSHSFSDIGVYVIRDESEWFLIRCGKNGTEGIGGHTHNDLLSFELAVGECNFIVDPGTFTYNRSLEARNRFRSTEAHNTLRVDGDEINTLPAANAFVLGNQATFRILQWNIGEHKSIFEGEHSGFCRLPQPVLYRRRVEHHHGSRRWTLTDTITGAGIHLFEWHFHFGTDCACRFLDSNIVVQHPKGLQLEIHCSESVTMSLELYDYSMTYGHVEKSHRLKVTVLRSAPFELIFTLTISAA